MYHAMFFSEYGPYWRCHVSPGIRDLPQNAQRASSIGMCSGKILLNRLLRMTVLQMTMIALSDSSSSSSSDTDDDVLSWLGTGCQHARFGKLGCRIFQHKRTKTLRLLPTGPGTSFLCGREITADYDPFLMMVHSEEWKCKYVTGGGLYAV